MGDNRALVFCDKCQNVMVLTKRVGKRAEYKCRSCSRVLRMNPIKLEIKESVEVLFPSRKGREVNF